MLFASARRVMAGAVASAFLHLALAGSAAAASIPDNLSTSLSYRVVGTISASCSLSQPVQDVEVVGLQNPDTDTVQSTDTDLPFTVSCTAPVKVSMASAKGGLQTDNHSGDADFASLVGYHATLDLPGASAALDCRSDQMTNGGAQCVGQVQDAAIDGSGRIRIHTAASGELLLAGTYNDTVTLTISPQLDGDGHCEGDD
jgi:hypothetical protein